MILRLPVEALRCIFRWFHPRFAARLARSAASLAITWREPGLRSDAICWLCRDADRRSAGLARSVRRRLVSQRILVSLCSTPLASEVGWVLLDVQCHETRRRVLQAIGHLGAEGELFTSMVVGRLSDHDSSVRRQAISTLNQLGTVAIASNMLVQCLRDKDALVRETAVQALAPFVNAESAVAFADCLNDTSEKVKKVVAKLLPSLLSSHLEIAVALLNHCSAIARRDAVVALGSHGDAASPWASQLACCLEDHDGRVRRASAKALAMCGCSQAYARELVALLRDPDACEEAYHALEIVKFESINATDHAGISSMKGLVSELTLALACPRIASRDNAISLLLRLDSRGMEVGVASMRSASKAERASALVLLGKFGPSASHLLHDIVLLLDDEDATVRVEATKAVTSICVNDAPEFVNAKLRSTMDDTAVAVSASAISSLHQLKGVAEYASVVALRLRSNDASLRVSAATALSGPWGSPFVLDVLALLDDEDPLVRKASVFALRSIEVSSTSHVASMSDALAKAVFRDPFVEVRRIACEILGKACGIAGMIAVAKQCGIEDIGGRWVTIVSGDRWVLDSGERCRKLSELSSLHEVALPFASIVADQLCDHLWEVRVAAARALASLGAKDFTPRLQALMRPGVPPFVRSAVAEALASLDSPAENMTNLEAVDEDLDAVSDHSSDSGPLPIWDI